MGQHWFPSRVSRWCFELICTVEKFRSLQTILSLPEFIQCRLVIHWYIISEGTQVTDSLCTTFNEVHVRVYVCFTSITSKWTLFSIINIWDIGYFICIFYGCHFSQWLHNNTKWDLTSILHSWVLRCIDWCRPHVLGWTLTFIYRDKGDATARWYFVRFREILLRNHSSCIVLINVLQRSGHLVIVDLLLSCWLGLSLTQVLCWSCSFYIKDKF